MSFTVTKSISQLSQSIEVKDIITFSLNLQHLNQNFTLVKQCLIKMHQMQGSLSQYSQNNTDFAQKLTDLEHLINNNQKEVSAHSLLITQLQNNIGDQFMKTMYGIKEKTKNMLGFDETVQELQNLNKFMRCADYQEREKVLREELNEIKKMKDELQRYVPKITFQSFKDEIKLLQGQKESKINDLNKRMEALQQKQSKMNLKIEEIYKMGKQNQQMIKQINFAEMIDKMKKFRQDFDQKINDVTIKMKKKVGTNELIALEQTMIEKLDKFLTQNEKNKAQKVQTRQALLFLEKRLSDIQQIFAQKAAEDQKDALFSVKKWQCASCTKDLGKYEGKLGQYRPWSIFPCKELDPQKTGGFGYMSYLDKVNIKKGPQESVTNTQRLNKTLYETQKQGSPKKASTTARMSNLISNFGSQQKHSVSLKDAYFRQTRTDKGQRGNKFFRVKKQSKGNTNEQQKVKQT